MQGSLLYFLGFGELIFKPLASPLAHTSPSLVSNKEQFCPAEISETKGTPDIFRGLETVRVPISHPNCPNVFIPQLHTFPSISRNKEWKLPPEMDTIGTGTSNFTGNKAGKLVGTPNCPYELSPQLQTSPESERNSV